MALWTFPKARNMAELIDWLSDVQAVELRQHSRSQWLAANHSSALVPETQKKGKNRIR